MVYKASNVFPLQIRESAACDRQRFYGHRRGGSEVPRAQVLHQPDGLPVQGQIGHWRSPTAGGRHFAAGQTAGGDGCSVHVPEHKGFQAAATREDWHHRTLFAVLTQVGGIQHPI